MIKCYHARRPELVVNTEPQLFYEGLLEAPLIAGIDSDSEKLEDIWDCCNNSCWWDRSDFREMDNYNDKFKVKFTPKYMGYCNDDLIVEMKGVFFIAKSVGWKHCISFNDALEYARQHSYWCRLHSKGKQHPTGKEHTREELEQFKADYESKGIKCFIYRN